MQEHTGMPAERMRGHAQGPNGLLEVPVGARPIADLKCIRRFEAMQRDDALDPLFGGQCHCLVSRSAEGTVMSA
jgi:hypothetical protein